MSKIGICVNIILPLPIYNTLKLIIFQDILYRKVDILKIAGIVAEFNPLHNGHKYLIDCAKSNSDLVVCVISSNFVQRGEPSIISKFERAKIAVSCDADICIELPTPWAMSTAQNFALGAISQLIKFNIDTLYFGSESGDLQALLDVANVLNSKEFNESIKNNLNDNITYAKLRQNTLYEFLGEQANILSGQNDTLAVEYISAVKKFNKNIEFMPVKRQGAQHNDTTEIDEYSTSTLIRQAIRNNEIEKVKKFVPEAAYDILENSNFANVEKLNLAIMAKLKTMKYEEFSNLPDISEGIENRLYGAIKSSINYNDLCEKVKTKRYTMARIRRLILSAFLGIDNSFFLNKIPYARVLATNEQGIKYISKIKTDNIVLQVSELNKLDEFSNKIFDLECKISDVYNLALENAEYSGSDYTQGLIKK